VIAAGGTAGHVVPALAVADALRAEGAEVVFVGGERAEAEAVPAAGYEFHQLRVEGLSRRNPFKAVRALVRAVSATRRARRLLRSLGADVVMGGGGYVAGPVGLAARLEKIPLVLTEADSHLGLTNRLLAPFARRVCLAFPIPGRTGEKFRVTGRPVSPPATDRAAARARFDIPHDEAMVLVFGGSLGARSINNAAITALAEPHFFVLHAAGVRDFESLTAPGDHYDLRPYIDDFGEALLAADLVVARAGGSVFEITAHGRPAILIPYPHATADHQTDNARWMADAGAAVVLADDELMPMRLRETVYALLDDPERLALMREASESLARPAAARAVAAQALAAAGDSSSGGDEPRPASSPGERDAPASTPGEGDG
jgi:UDP-N-acetylglucosamine--N-acetylmuramyl-(pentapeptide) pyrophosphoryl-undecaprenol N-acetylglucosamine transferase